MTGLGTNRSDLGEVEGSNDLRDGKIIKYLDLAFLTPPTSHHPTRPNDDNVINELLFYCSFEFDVQRTNWEWIEGNFSLIAIRL